MGGSVVESGQQSGLRHMHMGSRGVPRERRLREVEVSSRDRETGIF